MTDRRPIGVYDSGLGGLTVVREMKKLLPNERIIYFGDTARAPYGEKSPEQILEFSKEIIAFFSEFDVKMVVAACNTSSALALPHIKDNYGFPLVGLIEPGVKAALEVAPDNQPIALWATKATVRSGAYERSLRVIRPETEVVSVACPLLVPLVEAGLVHESNLNPVLDEYLGPVKEAAAQTLILGCTHYPFLSRYIQKLAPDLRLVDPAAETVSTARGILREAELLSDKLEGSNEYYVSGDPVHFGDTAKILIGEDLPVKKWSVS